MHFSAPCGTVKRRTFYIKKFRFPILPDQAEDLVTLIPRPHVAITGYG